MQPSVFFRPDELACPVCKMFGCKHQIPKPTPLEDLCTSCKRSKVVCNCKSTVATMPTADEASKVPDSKTDRREWVIRRVRRMYLEHDPAGIERLLREELR
jgi:hypothetical protein